MSTKIESLELEIVSNSQSAIAGLNKLSNTLGKLNGATGRVKKSNDKASLSFANFAAKAGTAYFAVRKLLNSIGDCVRKSSDYVENVNLFTVAMGEYAESARENAEIIGEAMGIDPGAWMRNQGVFMTLATGFGVAGDRASVMSEQLTQLGYDISSFYNISVEDAMQKLQSGISGELEPLRRLGYDLSQAKLEATALSLGIDKSVSSMTQAEKAQLRYYAIMTQVTTAQGDMARTLDSPSNQMRIFKAEVEQAARAIGNIFIPTLQAILPYAIAVVKVIRIIANTMAALAGFKENVFDNSGIETVTGGAEDTSDALDSATDSAKKLKSYMLGFDELNVINPNEGSSENSDIASQFEFELPTYEFMSENMNSKVNSIVEKMKEWLGITEGIDSWSELFDTRLGNILITVGLIGGALALWKITSGFTKAIGTISALFGKKGIGGTGGASGITSPKTVLKGLANVAIIVGGVIALVTTIGLLTKIPGFNTVVQEGISSIGTVFTGLLPILAPIALVSAGMVVIGKVAVSQVAKGLANTAIIIDGTVAVITAIGALISIPYFSDFLSTGITSVTKVFNGLYDIAIPIGILSAYMVAIGLISPATVASGLAGFAIVIGGTVALITAIGALMTIPYFSEFLSTGITSLQSTFNGLYDIALPIGVLSALLIALGIATPAVILSGLAGFALVVGGFEVLLVALGALKQIPGFTWIVDEGGEVLAKLGNTLGKFAGSIIGGFGEGLSNSFPKIGKNLAGFMENAEPFFNGLEKVNDQTVNAVAKLANIVLTLTAVDVMEGLTSWFTGGNSLIEFGKDLEEFAPHIAEYANTVKGIDAKSIEASANAAKMLADFAENLPNEGGVVAWFTGENDLEEFGKKLPSFGKNIKKYADSVKGLDASVVENSANAAKSIVAIANEVPNEGGVASWFAGENDIEVFGRKLPSFGRNIKKYADEVRGLDTSVVTNSINAAKSVVAFANNIPNSGGVASWFAGENDIDVFGEKLPSFGANFKTYYNNIKGIDTSVVTNSATAAASIVAICEKIPNSGGVASWFAGDNTIDDFGGKLATFGKKFKEYYDLIKGMSTTTITNITKCIGNIIDFAVRIKKDVEFGKVDDFTHSIKELGKAIKNLPDGKTITLTLNKVVKESDVGSVFDAIGSLPLFANGGFPETGQMFIAREAGAEMVGNIGRRTAVANNDQIVNGIANGVAEANDEQNALLREQNSLLRAIYEKESGVYLDGRALTNSVEKYQRERGRTLIVGGVV